MNLLEKRSKSADDILQGKFIRQVFGQTAKDIDQDQTKVMTGRGFHNENWFSGRQFAVTDNSMDMTVLTKHRFVDMKTRDSSKGKHRKKNHPVYNKIVWGHYNNVVREMAYGFTEAVKAELHKLED